MMSVVGKVKEIWRYPVKSMQGESLSVASFQELGIPGDREWALKDEVSGEIRGAKKFPKLMQCQARYLREPAGSHSEPVEIMLPNGDPVATSDANVNEVLSKYLDREVSLHPRRPATDLDHYKRRVPLTEEELRDVLAREPDESLPDLSLLPSEIVSEITEFTSPRGTYFDAYPVHLITTSWLNALSSANPASRFEAPRFRPNLLIEGATEGFAELDWCGKALRIGEVIFECQIPTLRCGMTTQATADLPKDGQVLRTIVRGSEQNVGIYATTKTPGAINVGDAVTLV